MLNCREIQRAVDSASRRSDLAIEAEQHLKSCDDCEQYATGTFQLMGLLAAQPRVEAPADFDFRLRARIARARDERQGWRWALAQFWSNSFSWNSFSWKEAGAAAVLLAAVTISATYYVNRDSNVPNPDTVAVVTPTVTVPARIVEAAETQQVVPPSAAENRDVQPERRVSPRALNTTPSTARTVALIEAPPTETSGIPGAQEILIYQPGRAGKPGGSRSVVIPRRGQVAFGAQLASVRDVSSRPAAQSAIETF